MFAELRDWASQVLRHWVTLVVGSALAAIYLFATMFIGKTLPPQATIWILFATLFVASFQAWRDQTLKLAEAQSALSSIKGRRVAGAVYVNQPLKEVMNHLNSLMSSEAASYVERFRGKRKVVSGIVIDRAKNGNAYSINLDVPDDPQDTDITSVIAQFGPEWNEHLELLSRGHLISVDGEIGNITPHWVGLQGCILID